jgi:hypothetical protein
MGQSISRLRYFSQRRIFALLLTLAAALALASILSSQRLLLYPTSVITGWLLGGIVAVLVCYNIRKKLPIVPLGKSATWLQIHIYLGVFSIFVFLLHCNARLPRGPFNMMLFSAYAGAALSGIIGLVLTRLLPMRLTLREREVVFERIPFLRRRLQERCEQLILNTTSESDAGTLAGFYTGTLAPFLTGPRNFWRHLFQPTGTRHRVLFELSELDRYLDDAEKKVAAELTEIIAAKDDLDAHYALQATLKTWLFVHIPLSWSLVLLGAMHVVIIHAFRGNAL